MLKEKLHDLLVTQGELYSPDAGLMSPDEPITYTFCALILRVAGYDLQITENRQGQLIPKLPMNAPEVEDEWIVYERTLSEVTEDFLQIPALARQVWAAEYGKQEALELPFYDRRMRDGDGDLDLPGTERWWDCLGDVEPSEICDFLLGEDPASLNGPEGDD